MRFWWKSKSLWNSCSSSLSTLLSHTDSNSRTYCRNSEYLTYAERFPNKMGVILPHWKIEKNNHMGNFVNVTSHSKTVGKYYTVLARSTHIFIFVAVCFNNLIDLLAFNVCDCSLTNCELTLQFQFAWSAISFYLLWGFLECKHLNLTWLFNSLTLMI